MGFQGLVSEEHASYKEEIAVLHTAQNLPAHLWFSAGAEQIADPCAAQAVFKHCLPVDRLLSDVIRTAERAETSTVPKNATVRLKTDEIMMFLFCIGLIKEVLSLDNEIQKLAEELYQEKSVLIMGRGYHYATCLEGALVRPNTQVHI